MSGAPIRPDGTVALSWKAIADRSASDLFPTPKKNFREPGNLDMLLWFRITKDSRNETLLEDSCYSRNRHIRLFAQWLREFFFVHL
jgi:hypothetical protein